MYAYRSDAGMISQHKATHAMARSNVRRLAGQGDLNRSWTPRDEGGELALTDAEEGLVDLG